MNSTTKTLLAIDTAARTARGDFHATVRATARFCTEALVDAAQSCIAGMSTAEREKFASSITAWTQWSRDVAVATLCAWVSCVQLREWSDAFVAARAAAQLAFPFAIEQLGAAL